MDVLLAILLYWGLLPTSSPTPETPVGTTTTAVADDPGDGGTDIAKPRACGNRCSY
ncbi:hypothetical protein [Lysobacter claricitrinus]|uniref:hypothetical protein n=1 Tax=Lysobacter claricitrinus TaxID=3367728 RepID=UPI0037DAC16B